MTGKELLTVGMAILIALGVAAELTQLWTRQTRPTPMAPSQPVMALPITSEVLPSVNDNVTLTLGQIDVASSGFSVMQPFTVHNGLPTSLFIVRVECGLFERGKLIRTSDVFVMNVMPNGDGFSHVTEINLSDHIIDQIKCRIYEAR